MFFLFLSFRPLSFLLLSLLILFFLLPVDRVIVQVLTKIPDIRMSFGKTTNKRDELSKKLIAAIRVYQRSRFGVVKFDPLVLVEGSNVFMANCMKIFMGEFGPVNGDIEAREMDDERLRIS